MKILLLGGSGYIGSKYYSKYESKHSIVSIDLNLFSGNFNYSNEINYKFIFDDEILSDIFHTADVIVCLAGHSSVQMCESSPQNSWVNNVDNFRLLCDNLSNQKLIYASSASVYGNDQKISYETLPVNFNPISHYDLQKVTIDMIANMFIRKNKNIIGLRFGTVNGVSPNTRRELMINSMVYNALTDGVVNVKNLHIRRAILGINDLVDALNLIVENDITPGQYNLSSFNSTVKDIAYTVAKECSAKLITHPDDDVSYDFEMLTEKFQKATGFVFKDTIESLVKELKDNHETTTYTIRNDDANFDKFQNFTSMSMLRK